MTLVREVLLFKIVMYILASEFTKRVTSFSAVVSVLHVISHERFVFG